LKRLAERAMNPGRTDEGSAGFLDHLEELRRRILIVIAFWVVSTACAYAFAGRILSVLLIPLSAYQDLPVFRSPVEPFLSLIRLSLAVGGAATLPVFLLETWFFVSPGLTPRERSIGRVIAAGSFLCTYAGACFGILILLPLSLRVLFGFGRGLMQPLISITEYLNFVFLMAGGFAAVFNVPVVLFGLTFSGLVPVETLIRVRKFAYLGAFVLSAVATPTVDPFTQLAIAVPLILLYEVSILVPRIALRKRKKTSELDNSS